MFPHKCVRCGFCCLVKPCPMIRKGIKECPHLTFHGDEAECGLAPTIVPVGDGCCIKAKAYRRGVAYDFAAMPKWKKIIASRQFRGLPAIGPVQ